MQLSSAVSDIEKLFNATEPRKWDKKTKTQFETLAAQQSSICINLNNWIYYGTVTGLSDWTGHVQVQVIGMQLLHDLELRVNNWIPANGKNIGSCSKSYYVYVVRI